MLFKYAVEFEHAICFNEKFVEITYLDFLFNKPADKNAKVKEIIINNKNRDKQDLLKIINILNLNTTFPTIPNILSNTVDVNSFPV